MENHIEEAPVNKSMTIRDKAVKSLCKMIEKYSAWQEEQGVYLPPDYAADPTGWAEDLHRVRRAFKIISDEMNGQGELWEAKMKWARYGEKDTEKINELEKEIVAGFTIFGKQLLYLTDTIKKEDRSH